MPYHTILNHAMSYHTTVHGPISDIDGFVNSVLYDACVSGDVEAAELALGEDDDVNYQWNDNAQTALHAAAKSV